MKVYKFYSEQYFYAVAALSEKLAREHLIDYMSGLIIDKVEEIPESEWDVRNIAMYEDNDREKKQFFVSIREEICGDEPQIVYTNDHSIID